MIPSQLKVSNVDAAVECIHSDLSAFSEAAADQSLTLNANKFKTMLFGKMFDAGTSKDCTGGSKLELDVTFWSLISRQEVWLSK